MPCATCGREDPARLRRPVRWLRRQNALHYWVDLLTLGDDPLCGVADPTGGKWVTAASLFSDAAGRAFSNQQLEHGIVASDTQRRWLENVVPRKIEINI